MTEKPHGQPDQTEQPKVEQKEEFDIQMELLDIGEFEKDTHKLSQDNEAKQIKTNETGTVVLREIKEDSLTTLYDPQGNLLRNIKGKGELQFTDDEELMNVKDEIINKFIKEQNWNKEWQTSPKAFMQSNGIKTIMNDKEREYFLKLLVIAGFEENTKYTIGEYIKSCKKLLTTLVLKTDELTNLNIDFSTQKNPFYIYAKSNRMDTAASSAEFYASVITLTHLNQSIYLNKEENEILILDHKSNDPETWVLTSKSMPGIDKPTAVGMDYKGNFLLVAEGDDLYVFDYHANPIVQIATLHEDGADFKGMIQASENGTLLVGDNKGNLRKILTNFNTFASHNERKDQKKLAQRLKAIKRLKKPKNKSKKGGEVEKELTVEFDNLSTEMLAEFEADIDSATSSDDLHVIRQEADAIRREYAQFVTDKALLNNIVHPTFEKIAEKESEIITKEVEAQQGEIKSAVDRIDTMGIDELISMSVRVGKLRGNVTSARIAKDVRKSVLALCDDFGDKSSDILKASESAMIEQLAKMVEKQKQVLAKMTKLSEFNEWLATDYPGLKEQITFRQKQAPASHTQFMQYCLDTETQLRELKDKYSKQFAEQYEEVKQQTIEKTDILGDIVEGRVEEFLEDFEAQVQRGAFDTGEEAQNYAELSQLYQSASNSLDDLEENDSDRASHLRRRLKVKVAETVHMVKRMKSISVDEKSGKQVTTFGDETMEKWEHKVKKKHEVQTELSFKVDERSKGPGIKPADYMCELVLKIKDKSGKTLTIPFHEDDMRKYGLDNDRYYENSMSSSYLSIKEAKKIIKAVKEMNGRRNTDLKKEYQKFRGRIKDVNGKILEAKKDWEGKWMGPRHAAETSGEAKWQQLFNEREALTKEYIQFIQKSGLYAWLKVKNVQNKYEKMKELFKNGQGFVPETKSHWTRDPQTEKYLEEFAKNAKLSLELRDGMISLEGHAGTGKDVLIEMFCAETNRPKFSFDCTKWTTEFELSQDVSLSAEGGASYTVKEDSIVVQALETPGAVLYFNEFNALPEQAQIFLHSLFDEKRQVTLKTSGGRVVKAHPTVIFCSSMNPGYRGTNDPQFATRSRMIPIKLKYPEFKMQDGTFGPSEALRMGRSISSLEDLTYDPDMQTNEFVNIWQNYINKSDEGMMTPEQKFDMEVIFSLLTFGNKLRDAFVKFVGKTGSPRDFKISQPFTGREMRRCAYVLSHMEASEKNNVSDAEEVAKNLIRRFYSQYIFNEKEADELETQLKTWTTQKP